MDPFWRNLGTFFFGLLLLVLFGWYLAADAGRRKRVLGTLLTVLLVAFCLETFSQHKINLGLDLQGGTSFLIQLKRAPGQEKIPLAKGTLDQAVEVIRKRVDKFGVSEPVITPQGTDRILVQIPGLDAEKIEEARQQLQQVAKLEFKEVDPNSAAKIAQIESGAAIIPPDSEIASLSEARENQPERHEEKLLLKKRPVLTGDRVTRAFATYDQRGWGVALRFDSQGAKAFDDFAATHEHQRFAIVLDGKVQSAPVLQSTHFGGEASITGSFTEQEARNLASVLENPLATPVAIEETRSASSTLGSDSIRSGIYAGVGGLALVLIFVAVYYRLAGIVAILGLVINIVLLFGAMSMFNFVLTLPGIAGVILTIGLAVDANVLIYERLREEMDAGKSLGAAVESAYDKAFSVIFDANVTTLITAGILFWKASGPVKGFAVTLVIGIIASVFSAMVVTRTVFGWMLEAGWLRRITMLHLIPSGKNFDFLGKRRIWAAISLTVIAISAAGFFVQWDPATHRPRINPKKNFGIDFEGGDLLTLQAKQPVTEAEVREALHPLGLAETVIQKERALNKEFITVRSPVGTSERIEHELETKMPQAGFTTVGRDAVGSVVGSELAHTSFWALTLGVLGILIYVTMRFELAFAVGAIVALLHDVIITVGLFALFGRELSLIMIGAILTIAGYSINDTIVVYDRIREGLHAGRKGSIQEIMNASINETLSRTLLTSGCTLLSVLALFLFGGAVLRDFAFAILIGVVVGTYSSIFIASPIVLWWSGHKAEHLKPEVRGNEAAPVRV